MLLAIVLVNLPLALLSLIWLTAVTDWTIFRRQLLLFVVLLVALVLLTRQQYQILVKIPGWQQRLPISNSLAGVLQWALLLIFSPSVIWLSWIASLIVVARLWREANQSPTIRGRFWFALSFLTQSFGPTTLVMLVAAAVYTGFGGVFPLATPHPSDWLPALAATATLLVASFLLFLPTFLVVNTLSGLPNTVGNLTRLGGGAFLFALFSVPFAIPLALTYSLGGWPLFLTTVVGLTLINWLAYNLGQANARSRVRADALSVLEQLGQALIQAPPDASTLRQILAEHVPKLFAGQQWGIRLFPPPDQPNPPWPCFSLPDAPVADDAVWRQLSETAAPLLIHANTPRPGHTILMKITEVSSVTERILGGIYLLREAGILPLEEVGQLLQELAGQIGAVLYRAQVHAETMAHGKVKQELELAWRIQSSFLPGRLPALAGWQLAVTLLPARQTSGDFYDFVELDNGCLGLIVADVADKGTGAALYMALSRTLIRTYALQYPNEPARALQVANERILADTESDQFVTVFYAILSPENGMLTYANAGHNPAFIVGETERALSQTGIPLGMFPGMSWRQEQVPLHPGDMLVAYSDGVSEAQNGRQEEFGEDRLLAVARANRRNGAAAVQQAVVQAVQTFVDTAPQFDDLTLVVAVRG